jgi:hypothetical protein
MPAICWFLPTVSHILNPVLCFGFADKAVQHRHEIQKVALKEYYEKHGGAPDHH